MPTRRKINLEKVNASLATPCPQCGHEIIPAEVLRINSTQMRCPKYGVTFTTSTSAGIATLRYPGAMACTNEVMESRGITRKSAVKFLSRERNGPRKAVTPVTSAPVAPAVR